MLFQQQKKNPQYGKDSFNNFMGDLKQQTKNVYKSFKSSASEKFSTIDNPQQLGEVPKTQFHGAHWDAKHLNNFLSDKTWSTTPTLQTNSSRNLQIRPSKYGNGTPLPASMSGKRKTPSVKLDGQTLNSNNPINSHELNPPTSKDTLADLNHTASIQSESRPSYFFHSIGRFVDRPEENYQVRDFASNYSTKNFLVSNCNKQRDAYNKEAAHYYQINCGQNERSFQQEKLNIATLPVTLQNPAEKLKELKEVKKNQLEYKQWKEKEIIKSKKHRLHTYDYRSGIMQVDDPYNENSDLYHSDAQKMARVLNAQSNRILEKQQLMKRHITTNNHIEFFNSNSLSKVPTEKPIDPKYEKMNPIWKNKKRVEDNFMKNYADSQNRLFGSEQKTKFNYERAKYLLDQDTRGRTYDLLSYSKKNLELPVQE